MDRDQWAYVVVRRLRALLGEERFARLGGLVPQCRLREADDPDPLVLAEKAAAVLEREGRPVAGARLLAAGCGPTNGMGYALAAMGAIRAVCHDPRPGFDVGSDAKHLAVLAAMHPRVKFTCVARAAHLAEIPDGFFDAAVVEPAGPTDPRELADALRRLLVSGGVVVWRVDCREPLERYPYHRLLFSKATGNRLAGPDPCGPWRCDDHVAALTGAGFDVAVPVHDSAPEAFALIADRLHPDHARRDPGLLAVTRATLVGRLRRPGEALPPLDPSAGGHDAPRTPPQGGKG